MSVEVEEDFSKLPIEERCVHKSWRARVNGYEEAIKLFRQLDEDDPKWNKFTSIVKKFVIDSNAIAQEKGLEATLIFVENSVTAERTVGDIMTGLITKCYGAPKIRTIDVATQITLMFIEIEKQEVVLNELIKGMNHKFPKIVATCIKVVTQSIKVFGSNVFNLKPLLKILQKILVDKDKNVRDEAKLLTIEIYSWIGPIPVKANLSNLKHSQIQELEVEFAKISINKPQPIRFLRSQKQQASQMDSVVNLNEEAILEEEVDAYEYLDPVNILCKLNNEFYEKLEAKPWQERKEAIDMLEGILSKALKLENGEYGDLIRALQKVITKDTNVIIVSVAVKCITMLVKGLKKKFEIYAPVFLPKLLEKFKEKKQNVILLLRDAVDAIYLCMTLESIKESILTSIESKNPSVKAESVLFLARCFTKCTPSVLNKKLLKVFTTALIKTLNESDPIVRDNSAEALGTAWKVVSEKNILPFLNDVDPIKFAKIKEAAKKAIITAKTNNVEKKSIIMTNKKTSKNNNIVVDIPNKTTVITKVKKICASGDHEVPLKVHSKNEVDIDDNALEELALTFCPLEILNGMDNTDWKIRLFNVQEYVKIIDEMEPTQVSSQVLIKLLIKKSGLKDKNVQIQKLRLECLKKIINNFSITNIGMNCCLHDVSALLGDNKISYLAKQVLTTLAESTRFDLVFNAVLEYAFTLQKNPKVQIESLNWLSIAILEFGFIIEPKIIMQNVKKAVNVSNPQVRMAVISFLGTMYLYMGNQLRQFFENEKPTLMQQINAEFEKRQGDVPPKPIRGKKIRSSVESLEINSNEEKPDNGVNIQDIVPSVDITSQISDSLINEFSDKDWNVRFNALTKLKNIISEAKCITSELGKAREALQERINDTNARLSSSAINLIESISIAMGPPFKNYIKFYLPSVLNALGDSKSFKCQSARQCMNTWADICGYRNFFGNDILLDALKNNSVILRSELWSWLADNLPSIPSKTIPSDELQCFLPILYSNLEDRNVSVRIASDKAVLGFMMHLGYQYMHDACEKLKPISLKFCKDKLDKERYNLPIEPIENLEVVKLKVLKKGTNKLATKAKENIKPHTQVTINKKKEELNNVSLFQQNNLKHQRDIDEHKLKSLKWNFTMPRKEFVQQLQEQMITAGINKLLITNMFHSDFRYHLEAIKLLSEDLQNTDNDLKLINNLDLILKWITLRFFDTNPSVVIKCLLYLQLMFDKLILKKYIFHHTEASSFIPYLLIKLGDSKDSVRNNVHVILKQITFLFPNSKMFYFIMEGVKSKNSRQRLECLEHLATMIINDKGTSFFRPSVAIACREIAKSIGDRDISVRMAALNCFVTAFPTLGDDLFKFISNIPEKDMTVLKERLKKTIKNNTIPVASVSVATVPIATVQPTVKMSSPVQQISNTGEVVDVDIDNENNENNATFNVLQEYNHESSSPRNFNDFSSQFSSEVDINEPKMTRFALDEKLIQELDAEVIIKPELKLKPYNWPIDNDEVHFWKILKEKSQYISKPCLNVSPYNFSNIVKSSEVPSIAFDSIHELIKQVTSHSKESSTSAFSNLNKILLEPNMILKFLEDGNILSLFNAIIKQFDILFESNHINLNEIYKPILKFCLNLYKYPELVLILNEQIIQNLLSKLLNLLCTYESDTDKILFLRNINLLILNVLDRSDHTSVLCALLTMLYDTVKYSQNSTSCHKELVMKCIWKKVKGSEKWRGKINYDLVLSYIYKFLKEFDFKYWKTQPSDIPLKTCKTVLHTLIKMDSGVLESLAISKYPQNSAMVLYIYHLLRCTPNKPKTSKQNKLQNAV